MESIDNVSPFGLQQITTDIWLTKLLFAQFSLHSEIQTPIFNAGAICKLMYKFPIIQNHRFGQFSRRFVKECTKLRI